MKSDLLSSLRFLHHNFLSRSKFDIHSPFVYKFYSEILKDKTDYPEYQEIIKQKSDRKSLLSVKDCRLLFRVSRYYKPETILILATQEDLSTSSLSMGCPASRIIILKNPDLITDVDSFDMVFVLCDHPWNLVPDYFSRTIQHIHNDSVLILCNIQLSKEIHELWDEIKNHSSVTLTIDLFNLGLVFYKEELTKEDFILRY